MAERVVLQMILCVTEPVFDLLSLLLAVDLALKRQSFGIVGIMAKNIINFLQRQLILRLRVTVFGAFQGLLYRLFLQCLVNLPAKRSDRWMDVTFGLELPYDLVGEIILRIFERLLSAGYAWPNTIRVKTFNGLAM